MEPVYSATTAAALVFRFESRSQWLLSSESAFRVSSQVILLLILVTKNSCFLNSVIGNDHPEMMIMTMCVTPWCTITITINVTLGTHGLSDQKVERTKSNWPEVPPN